MDDALPIKPRRTRGRRTLVVLSLVYLTVISCGRPADRLLLIPQRPAQHVYDATAQSLPFNGGSLEVYVARSPGARNAEPRAFMLEFTGNATRAEDIAGWVASRWGDRPVEAWVMNYPGYGNSTGPARLASLTPAALATYDALKKVAGDRPIFLAGNSMGSTVALHVAVKRPEVAGLILQNPPPLRQIVLTDHGWWNLWLLAGPVALSIPSDLDAIAHAKQLRTPGILITSDSDELVRPTHQKRILDAYAGPKRVITLVDKGHNDSLDRPDELKAFGEGLDWLLETATRSVEK